MASLLVPTLSKAAGLGAPGAGDASQAWSEDDSSPFGPQHTRASIAAAVVKTADGLTKLLFKQPAAADPALSQCCSASQMG